jgi:transcriptional regulator with XRE-family HTH domain
MDDGHRFVAVGRRITELREAEGLTQGGLAQRIFVTPAVISRAEAGSVLSEKTADDLDRYFRTSGELAAMRRTLLDPSDGASRKEDATDRREFGGLTLAAILDVVGEASDAMATADPKPLTLAEMEAEAEEIANEVYDVPAQVTLDRAATRWHQAHLLLARPVSDGIRLRLLLLAGGLACQAAHAGKTLGDAVVVRRFGTLASQYVEASRDPSGKARNDRILRLTGQVACLRSRIAFDGGQYLEAAEIAVHGRERGHPAQRARLAAYAAEALAAAGKNEEARCALNEMRAASGGASRWTDGDQIIFAAVTLGHLRDWEPAADLARQYAAGGDNDREGVAWAHATVGRCLLLGGDEPDPAAAAHAGVLALDATVGPDMTVLRRTAGLHAELSRQWPRVPEVIQLDHALATARAALPSGATARTALPSGPAEATIQT